jgi:L-threonylcarbamoyladenylate synthase
MYDSRMSDESHNSGPLTPLQIVLSKTAEPTDDADQVGLVQKAVSHLKAHGLVAIPTETVYGLAAAIDSEDGLKSIFKIKGRPFFDPLIVHVASIRQAKELTCDWAQLTDFLARSFWPGPFTIVVPKSERVNALITSGLETVAVRYPDHPLALQLIRSLGTPVAAPSANKFGKTSPSKASHVEQEFAAEIQSGELVVIDGGECNVGVESTIVEVSSGHVRILRPGMVTKEMLEDKLKFWSHPTTVTYVKNDGSIQAPGTLKHHYMPRIPLVLVDEQNGVPLEILSQFHRLAELRLAFDANLAARELYSELRRLGESGADGILFTVRSSQTNDDRWSAILDRLSRAATHDLRTQSTLRE